MNGVITCSAKEAKEFMKHLSDDDMVTLTVFNKKEYIVHKETKRIKKKKGEELIDEADNIEYQDNDFFGRISLFGVIKDKYIIQNILFPQLE